MKRMKSMGRLQEGKQGSKMCCERGKGGRLVVMQEGAAEEFP